MLIQRAFQLAALVPGVERLRRKLRFPGLATAPSATLEIGGAFTYGNRCTIGQGANIIVPRNATLALGDNCYVGRGVELGPAGTIAIGSDTSVQDRSILVGDVRVGRYCLISLNVLIGSGRHHFDLHPEWLIRDQDEFVNTSPELRAQSSRPVLIEDDCWIGINTVVMPGVTIGKGAVVGAASIVNKDVAPYTVVAGAPTRFMKQRLVFTPPRRLSHDRSEDLPYFYRGFEVSRALLSRNAVHGGLVARGEFALSLDTQPTYELHLIAKCLDVDSCELTSGQQARALSSEFREIVFDRQTASGPLVCLNSSTRGAAIAVREAWVQ